MNNRQENDGMGKEDRKRQVLKILVDSDFALPPIVIFRNAKLRGATFERRSVNNYLRELAEEGKIEKVAPAPLDDGSVEPVPLSDEGYFIATDLGRDEFEE